MIDRPFHHIETAAPRSNELTTAYARITDEVNGMPVGYPAVEPVVVLYMVARAALLTIGQARGFDRAAELSERLRDELSKLGEWG